MCPNLPKSVVFNKHSNIDLKVIQIFQLIFVVNVGQYTIYIDHKFWPFLPPKIIVFSGQWPKTCTGNAIVSEGPRRSPLPWLRPFFVVEVCFKPKKKVNNSRWFTTCCVVKHIFGGFQQQKNDAIPLGGNSVASFFASTMHEALRPRKTSVASWVACRAGILARKWLKVPKNYP